MPQEALGEVLLSHVTTILSHVATIRSHVTILSHVTPARSPQPSYRLLAHQDMNWNSFEGCLGKKCLLDMALCVYLDQHLLSFLVKITIKNTNHPFTLSGYVAEVVLHFRYNNAIGIAT